MKVSRIMIFLLIYLLILLTVFLLQRKMLYFPTRYTQQQQEELIASFNLQPWPSTSDLRGIMSRKPLIDVKGTVLVFHGNAGAALHRTYYIDSLQKLGYRVIIAEYPGYGVRSGTPSEAILIKDGIATAQMALHEFKEPLFLCGESLGSGVVAGIVASLNMPVKGLLLITPFDAMNKVAQHHYWFFLARWLLLDKFDNVPRLRDFQGNIAVLVAGQDDVIPNRRTMALFDALSERKKLWRFENSNHNSLPLEHYQLWWQEVMQFIDP